MARTCGLNVWNELHNAVEIGHIIYAHMRTLILWSNFNWMRACNEKFIVVTMPKAYCRKRRWILIEETLVRYILVDRIMLSVCIANILWSKINITRNTKKMKNKNFIQIFIQKLDFLIDCMHRDVCFWLCKFFCLLTTMLASHRADIAHQFRGMFSFLSKCQQTPHSYFL